MCKPGKLWVKKVWFNKNYNGNFEIWKFEMEITKKIQKKEQV